MTHPSHAVPVIGALALLVACGGDDPASTTGSGGSSSQGGGVTMGGGGSGGGGGLDPGYIDAIKASSWTKLEAAPSVAGGAKQDDIFFLDRDHGWLASGPNFALFETLDGGASWTSRFESPGTFFRALHFVNGQRGFAGNIGAGLSPSISDANVLYETSDGGASWSPITAIDGDAPQGLCNFTAVDDGHVFGVGRANAPSHLVTSSDGGASWSSIDLSPWLMMPIDARFTSPTEGVIVGMGAQASVCTAIRTIDGGQTFDVVFASPVNGSLCWKLDFPSDDVGYIAIQQTAVGPAAFAKTTDGGASWTELPLPFDEAYPAIGAGFITEDIGWMVSADADHPAFRTYDGGVTWDIDPSLQGPINRFRIVDETTAYAAGADVYKLVVDYTPGS